MKKYDSVTEKRFLQQNITSLQENETNTAIFSYI